MSQVALLAGISLISLSCGAANANESARGPVLVELFTSQGCSSCPPADRLLADLGDDDGVVALAFHVDYWNYIGWRDPFSSPAWSARQQAYAVARGWRVYTPQLVIDGRAHTVGSRAGDVRKQIRKAAGRAHRAAVTVRASRRKGRVHATVAATGAEGLDLYLAITDGAHSTKVTAGENDRRTLANAHVVRHLARVEAGKPTDVAIDDAWGDDLRVVAFAQDPKTRAIEGVAATSLR